MNNYIRITEENNLVYLQAIRNDREITKPILASKELIEMLTNDSVEYDEKTIYNYKKLLHGCLRPELDIYFYNLKSQGWNQSIWSSKSYKNLIKPKIEEMKNKYEKAN